MKCKSNKFFKRNLKKKHKIFKKRQKYSLFLEYILLKYQEKNFGKIGELLVFQPIQHLLYYL